MKLENIRKDFPILEKRISGKKIVYLDNAATSLKPRQVLEAEKYYYENECANVHRGIHTLSEEASIEFEKSHEKTASFINAKKEEVVFTKNTTESINLVMYSLYNSNTFKKGDKIVLTEMEHHSNIVPWQFLQNKIGAKIEFVRVNDKFEIDMNDFEKKVRGAKMVSVSGASNTIACKPNLKEIESLSHKEGALFCVDAAQMVPHTKINFKKMNADFVAFSGHKMCAPTGTGALIAKEELLEKMEPFLFGGDMIKNVSQKESTWNYLPYKFEAGTPNIAGSYGLTAAINYIEKIGFDFIEKQEKELTKLCINELSKIDSIKFYCPRNEKQGAIVLFESTKIPSHELALILSEEENICIRSGMHCAEPLISKFNKEGLARASFYFYNTKEEVIAFTNTIKQIVDSI